VILGLGLAAQTASSTLLYGLPMLVPQLRHDSSLSLAGAGWFVAAPSIGLMLTLILWGAVADRYGERLVIGSGLCLAAGFGMGAAAVTPTLPRAVLLGAAGAAGASVNAASGRVVLGWFAPHERGRAMGVRQTAQPLGVGLAALVLPGVAQHYGIGRALAVPAGLHLIVGVLVLRYVVDPPRGPSVAGAVPSASPYRTGTLWRLHVSSSLLVVPQFAVSAFALEYLVAQRHWDPVGAGRVLFAFQISGALGRLAAGWWSDRVGSRLQPMRIVSAAAVVCMLALGAGAAATSVLVMIALAAASVVTVADNGLGFTAVAELAGPTWAGRALGAQNTAQNVFASLTPPVLGAVIGAVGYGAAFASTAAFPLLALGTIPLAAETLHRARSST
jgi:sugar phosphate permease